MREGFRRISKRVNRAIDILTGLFLFAVFFFVFLNVVLRYLFHSGLAWSEEMARYMFVCMVVTGLVSVTHKRDHFFVDILVNSLHGWAKKAMLFVQHAIVIVLLGIMGKGSIHMALNNLGNKSPVLEIPLWIPYAIMAVSYFLMLLYMVLNLADDMFAKDDDATKETPNKIGLE